MERSNNIEQLWYTWAPRGMEQIRGFQVYAASSSLMDVSGATFKAINNYLGYSLPTGTDRQSAKKDNSPVCLAYVNIGNQRLLLRKNFTGSDTAGRIGTYFIHLLASLPENFTARDAILLWYSSFWQTAIPESESASDFKDPHSYELWSLAPDVLKPEPHTEWKFLQEETLAKYLPFAIQAYLSMNQDQRLLIAADDHQVASLVWGVTHCLPPLLQQDLTFSTYESDILKADMRIVGTCLPAPQIRHEALNMAQVLPTENYSGQYVMLNCYTGQTSALSSQYPLLPDYAQFATNCLLSQAGAQEELQNLLTSAEQLHVESVPQLLFVYKLIDADNKSKILSLEDISAVLENPNMAIKFLRRDNVQEALISLARQNQQWWEEKGKLALINLREQPLSNSQRSLLAPTFAALGHKATLEVANAILRKEQQAFDIGWDILLIATPPRLDPQPWVTLISLLSSYRPDEICSWELRLELMKKWQHAAAYIAPEQIHPWLSISWEQLSDFFQLSLPHEWQIMAATQLLSGPSKLIPPWIVKSLEQRPYQQLFLYVLRQMYESQRTPDQLAARNFMQTLLKYGYTDKLVLFDLLLSPRKVNGQIVEELLAQATLNQQEQLTVFEKYAEKLLSLHPASTSLLPSVQGMVKLYIDQFTVKTLININSEHMLTLLQRNSNKLSNELKQPVYRRYLAGQAIRFGKEDILPLDKFDETYLNEMGDAIVKLQYNNEKQYMDHLYYIIVLTIWSIKDKAKYLDQLLLGLRTVTQETSRKALLVPVVKYLNQLKVPPHQLFPYIKVALEYTLHFKTAQERGEYIFPLLNSIERLVRNNLNEIDAEAMNRWPPEIRNLWLEASKKYHTHPQSFPQILMKGISRLNPLGRQDTSSMSAAKPDRGEQKSASVETTKNERSISDSSNQRQAVVQPSQDLEANSSHKVTEMPQQATHNSDTSRSPLPLTHSRLQQRNIVSINKQELSPHLTKDWLNQVCDIKQTYFPFMRYLMWKDLDAPDIKDTPIAETVLEEIKELEERQMRDRDYLFHVVQQELVDDSFIQEWLNEQVKETKKVADNSINKSLKAILKLPKEYRKLKRELTEEKLKKIVLIFLRRHYVVKQKSKYSWEKFLREGRDKILGTIAYDGDDWGDGNQG